MLINKDKLSGTKAFGSALHLHLHRVIPDYLRFLADVGNLMDDEDGRAKMKTNFFWETSAGS